MLDERHVPSVDARARVEVYSNRDNPAYDALLARRTAEREARWFLPNLKPGMRLIDCGCGPGSITMGLARAVAPGEAVAVDIDARQVEAARALAAANGVSNLRLEVASIYDLPFPSASFDAAFAHTVLVHLREPLRALKELRRLLRPGGVAGVADGDWGTEILAPPLPRVQALHALQVRVRQHNGGDPFYARDLRRLLHEAGFTTTEAGAAVFSSGSGEATRAYAAGMAARFDGPAFAGTVIEQGWADHAGLAAMRAELKDWGERPDAFYAITTFTALGWAGGGD